MVARRSNPKGFTLLELILVMGIIVLMSAMIAPSLRGFGTARKLDDEASLLVGVAGYARTQAIAQSRPYRLNVDAPHGLFWLTVQDAGAGSFTAAPGDEGTQHQVPDGVTITTDLQPPAQGAQGGQATQGKQGQAQVPYVQFLPDGRTDPATITLTDEDGQKRVVACLSATEVFAVVPPAGAVR